MLKQGRDRGHCLSHPLLMRSAHQKPRNPFGGESLPKPPMHFATDMFPVPQPVLHKGNFIPREEVKIATASGGHSLDGLAASSHVTPVPEDGGDPCPQTGGSAEK